MDAEDDLRPERGQNGDRFSSPRAMAAHRALGAAVRGIEIALGVAFLVAVGLNFLTAMDRYLFGRSIVGSDEIQIFIMIYLTFVGAVVVAWRRQHLRMDVIVSRLPSAVRTTLLAAELVLVVGLTGLLASQSWKYASLMATIDRRSDLAAIPMWIPHAAIAVGFGLIAIVASWHFFALFAVSATADPEPVRRLD